VKIAFIGYGEAARAFRASLAEADRGLDFACYDILFESEGLDGPTARAAGGDAAETPVDAVAGSDWVFSAVTAGSSLEAAASVAGGLHSGQVFLDINSVSPARKRATAALMAAGGAVYVDMAVMSPVHPRGHRSPVLLSGRVSPALAAEFDRLGFAYEIVGEEIGGAAAVKLARSVFVKGLEAITVEALLAAEAAGCLERVAGSLAGSFPGLGWPDFAAYEFERTITHGGRRAEEMRESAAMLDELGLGGGLARAIAVVQDRMGASPDAARIRAMIERIGAGK
jgi:3-hydroxyisobutyrate dehydrogenase-like beta-hydroxyacid dehydrogenase